MSRWLRTGVLTAFAMTAGLAVAGKATTAKEIMGVLNKGPNSLTTNLKKGLQKDEPNWKDIQEQTKEYAALTADLNKATPPAGDKASWDKLTKGYADTAKALDTAAQKKDKAAALAAHGQLTKACMACHQVHRKK